MSRSVVSRGVSAAVGSWGNVDGDGDSNENDGDRANECEGQACPQDASLGGSCFAGGGGLSAASFFFAAASISRFDCSRSSNCSFGSRGGASASLVRWRAFSASLVIKAWWYERATPTVSVAAEFSAIETWESCGARPPKGSHTWRKSAANTKRSRKRMKLRALHSGGIPGFSVFRKSPPSGHRGGMISRVWNPGRRGRLRYNERFGRVILVGSFRQFLSDEIHHFLGMAQEPTEKLQRRRVGAQCSWNVELSDLNAIRSSLRMRGRC